MFGNSKSKKQNENEPLTPLSIYALGKATAYHACKLYRDVFGLKTYGAIFYNHESEVRPEEYVTRKITKSVARIFYGKQKKLILGDINVKIDWGYAKDYVEIAHKIVQQKKPDFFIMFQPSLRPEYIFYELCKKKNVIPLIINPSIIGYKTYISTKISDIDSNEKISTSVP